jgi:hypothetical protein
MIGYSRNQSLDDSTKTRAEPIRRDRAKLAAISPARHKGTVKGFRQEQM